MFADTHCHSIMKYVHKERKNLWQPFTGKLSLKGLINLFVGIPEYSQADFRTLAAGNVQIVFCVLHPPEQKILFHALKYTRTEGFLEKVAGQAISIPPDKIDEYQEPTYNHFDQLKKELQLLIDNKDTSGTINGSSASTKMKVRYEITRNFKDVERVLAYNRNNTKQRTITVVPTIEGLHSLGCGHIEFSGPNKFNVTQNVFLKRLDMIKGLDTDIGKGWFYSPFVANITHAFDNGICGHAQALSQLFKLLFQYAEPYGPELGPLTYEGLNKGLSPFGQKVIKRMLNLDNRAKPGRRIIPDIKHMSTRTRKSYYEIIKGKDIPVIMSHSAVNGKDRLDKYLDPKSN